ncbi:DNA-processing protein DprA [Candidatus Gracilibacteria bacterium]|nr:DNA-processing protein DprA [Candidatus Gracilibacteria bacterium]
MNENIFVAYLHSCGLSQKELTNIFEVEDSARGFFEGLSEEILKKFVNNSERRKSILENYDVFYTKKADKKIDEVVEKLGVKIIVLGDTDYPESLKNIPHTPYILYVRGKVPTGDMFGVVGARKITSYGKKVIEKLVPDIAKIFPIVSGGAAGCDTEAHKMTLKSGEKTVVVVGTGIDQCYPVGNGKLFNEVVTGGGAIVSIFRIGEPGNPYNFPVRNEIVVGLSRGILVVEAKEKSGSLITAGLCLDLGKDLFAVPGDITLTNSSGTNSLIQNGEAKCVINSTDILEEYHVLMKQSTHKEQLPLLDDLESQIYQQISNEEQGIDDLSEYLGVGPSELMVKLSMLELKKIIKKNMSGKYILA